MPMYSSRFATHMTTHRGLRRIAPAPALAYVGPEMQCQGATSYPSDPDLAIRCPHAASWESAAGALFCGNCVRRSRTLVVDQP